MTDTLSSDLQSIAGDFRDGSIQDLMDVVTLEAVTPVPVNTTSVRDAGSPASPASAEAIMASQPAIGSVDASVLIDESVTGDQIGAGQITGTHIAELSITADLLADNSVSQSALQDSAVSEDKIQAGAVTALKIGAGQITTEHISADGLDAFVITAGTLRVGGIDGVPEALVIYNAAGQIVATYDQAGVLFKDPTDTNKQVRFYQGAIEFSSDGGVNWGTAIDAQGITADALRIGTAPGGHNNVPNSSFETRPFQPSLLTDSWPSEFAWSTADTTIAATINMNTAGASLQLSTVTY